MNQHDQTQDKYSDHRLISQHPRRGPIHIQEEAKEQIQEMLKEAVIEQSNQILVRKKYGTYHYCIDYRLLNKITVVYAYPIPRVSFDHLEVALWFSTLDLQYSYWQFAVDPADKEKTAFVCKDSLF